MLRMLMGSVLQMQRGQSVAFARYRRSEISLRLRIDSVGRNRAGQLWVLNQRLRLPIEGGRLVDV